VVIEQTGEPSPHLPGTFRVVGADLFGRGLAHRARDERVEDLLLGRDGPLARAELDPDFFELLRVERDRFVDIRAKWPIEVVPRPWWLNRCQCAPIYEPAWWNVPSRQPFNNCYNYATNYRTDTFAQPGLAAGAEYTSLTCASVRPAAIADKLIDAPNADNTCHSNGHLVALVIWPGVDFHWYRKGRNGAWSHKPGGTPVTNLDNSGNHIPDPRTADRGGYTDFCTFMVVMHGHIKIQ
jgi:hypothetical protein